MFLFEKFLNGVRVIKTASGLDITVNEKAIKIPGRAMSINSLGFTKSPKVRKSTSWLNQAILSKKV